MADRGYLGESERENGDSAHGANPAHRGSGEVSTAELLRRTEAERALLHRRLDRRLRYEDALSRVSRILSRPVTEAIDPALEYLLEGSEVDRVYYFQNSRNEAGELCMTQTHESCASGVEPQVDNPDLRMFPYARGYQRWERELSAGRPIAGAVASFPDSERAILEAQCIRALLVVPVSVGETWRGFIGFDDTTRDRYWRDEDVRVLETVAHMIGIATLRDELQNEVRDREQSYRRLLMEAPIPIVLTDSQHTIIGWNTAADELFGIPAGEAMHRPMPAVLARVRMPTDADQLTLDFGDGLPNRNKEVIQRPDGGRRYLEIVTFEFEEGGRTVIGHAYRDVTRQRQLESELKERHERYTLATRAARVGIWEWNLSEDTFYVDATLKTMLGYGEQEFSADPRDWIKYVHGEDQEPVSHAMLAHLEDGPDTLLLEYRVVTREGAIRWMHVRGRIERDDDGRASRIIGTGTDVTERKEMELSLAQARTRLEGMLETTVEGMMVIDRNMRVHYLNPAASAILGVPGSVPHDLDISYWGEVATYVDGEVIDPHNNQVTRAIDRRESAYGDLIRIRTAPGEERWIFINVSPFEEGTETMALVSMRDVTRERNNEQKLEQSNAEKDALLREVYHRVKNNLSVLESLVRLEEDRIGDSDPVVLLENIRDRIHSIALVHEKLHRGADVARLRFDDYLSELVRHVVASMQAADSDIYPQFDLEPVDFGMNEAVPLGLIVTELVTNAVKYACRGRPDARLFVGLHAEDDGYVLSIQDNGPGLPDGFDPEASHSLGLRLVAGLTKQINGTLSWGSDGGAWFRIAVAERDPNH